MPRRARTTTIQLSNVTPEQKNAIEKIQATTGESTNALIKRLLREEAERLNITLPDDDLRDWTPRDDD